MKCAHCTFGHVCRFTQKTNKTLTGVFMGSRKKGGDFMETDPKTLFWMQRFELFSGKTETMDFPGSVHQQVISIMTSEIVLALRAAGKTGKVFTPPFAVFLTEDGNTLLQPDITVLCDDGGLDEKGFHGAPDWIIEVTTPSGKKTDYGTKLGAYINAGVREYWIVDPERQLIVTYYIEQPDIPAIYRFGNKIKSYIYEGLAIDTAYLKEITDQSIKTPEKNATGKPTAEKTAVSAVKNAESAAKTEPLHAENSEDTKTEKLKADIAQPEIMPTKMTLEEVKDYMEDNFAELIADKNKAQLMKAAMTSLKNRADSRTVSEAVACLL